MAASGAKSFREIEKFPAITRDIAMIVPEELSHEKIVAMMVGRELSANYFPPAPAKPPSEPILDVRDLLVPGAPVPVSFTACRGEILGFAGLVGLCLVLWILTPHFLTVSNLLNVAQQTAINAIIAVGLTFVIISGGIDLSVGSLVAFTGVVLASTTAIAATNITRA